MNVPRVARLPVALALIGCLLVAGQAAGQCTGGSCGVRGNAVPASPPLPAATQAAIARVVNLGPNGMRSYGSAALIGKRDGRGWVLTCQHLFAEGSREVWVLFPGERHRARLLWADRQWDVAVLEIDAPQAEPLPLAETPPSYGEAVAACGYGPDGRFALRWGNVLGYVQTGTTAGKETLALACAARDGDSGAPLLDRRGRIVGVLWGTDGRRTLGTYCGRLRLLLKRLGDRIALGSGPNTLPDRQENNESEALAGEGRGPGDQRELLQRLRDRIEGLAQRVEQKDEQSAQQQTRLSERLAALESALETARALRQRVEAAEERLGEDNVRDVVREVAAGVIAERGPRWIDTLLPALLTALGWSGPPSLAVILAARVLLRIAERRLREGIGGDAQ